MIQLGISLLEEQREIKKQNRQRELAFAEKLVAAATAHPNEYKIAKVVEWLETYLYTHWSSYSYSFSVNSYLLRHYRDNQDVLRKDDTQLVVHILVTGLKQLPANHFTEYVKLLPHRKDYYPVNKLVEIHGLLESHNYPKFWEEFNLEGYMFDSMGCRQAMEEYIINVLSMTYGKVPEPVFSEALNKSGRSLKTFINKRVSECGWVVEKDKKGKKLIIIPDQSLSKSGTPNKTSKKQSKYEAGKLGETVPGSDSHCGFKVLILVFKFFSPTRLVEKFWFVINGERDVRVVPWMRQID